MSSVSPEMTASLDDRVTVWIATHRWAPLDPLFTGLGTIEKLGAVWIALALVFGYWRWRRVLPTVGVAVLTAVVVFLADAATFGIKDLVARPRPFVAHPEIHPLYHVRSSSFPAGHAATAFAGAVILSALARRWTIAFAILAAAIAFSRIYVGDHYLGDVLGGAVVGAAIARAALAGVRELRHHVPDAPRRAPRLRSLRW
jgi:undecaprenyl-diphosphatase